jgi:GNAT superfamily N-acetyltransferase
LRRIGYFKDFLMSEEDHSWHITSISDTTVPACDLVRQWLREHNWLVNAPFMRLLQKPEHEANPLVLLASVGTANAAGSDVIGGLFAETQLAWLRISIMSVHPDWRSRGIGAALLAEAEREALARGCRHAYVDTMEYQAPRFYQSHGYRVVGEIPDWDSHGHRKMYFAKELGAPS